MVRSTAFWSFALIVGLLTLTPGLDTALILRTSALGRRRAAWGVVLGIQTGTLVWGALTSVGVTALLTASQVGYQALRWAGAVYLVWMGGRIVWATFTAHPVPHSTDPPVRSATDSRRRGWRQGTLTNLLNPKVGAFYVAVLPQFIPPGTNHVAVGLLLTMVHVVLGLAWSTVLIVCARVLNGWLRKPAARRLLDRLTGTVIAGFGIRLALSD